MKKIITLVLSALMVFTLAACGETSNSGDVSDISAEGVKTEATMETPATEEPVHEHTFTTVANNDGTHTTKCSDETCMESTTESCVFNEEYVCETCGYVHEHTLEAASNEDGTHTLKCTTEGCAYENAEACTLNADYVCEVCGYKHTHTLTVKSKNNGNHEETCSTCDYKKTVKCKDKNGTCETCGYLFHLSEYVCGKYTVFLAHNKKVGDVTWETKEAVGAYDSLDELCLAYFGEDWGTIKATWTYDSGWIELIGMQCAPSYMRSDHKYQVNFDRKTGEVNGFCIYSADLTSWTTYYVTYVD